MNNCIVPRVARMGVMAKREIRTPLIHPQRAPAARAATMAAAMYRASMGPDRSAAVARARIKAARSPVRLPMLITDRSMPPVTSESMTASAKIPSSGN